PGCGIPDQGGLGRLDRRRRGHAPDLLPHRLAARLPALLRRPRSGPRDSRHGHTSGRFPMRIGFLAMSGIRAHDPKLLELGLTLPGFVDRSKVVASLPSLGLLYLAAVTPPGHPLRYFEAEGQGQAPAELFDCDLVAISTFSAQVFEAFAIADRLRQA